MHEARQGPGTEWAAGVVIRFRVRISTYRSEARLRGLRVTAQRSHQRNEQRAGCVWWICKLSGDAFISVFGNAPTFICMSTYYMCSGRQAREHGLFPLIPR